MVATRERGTRLNKRNLANRHRLETSKRTENGQNMGDFTLEGHPTTEE